LQLFLAAIAIAICAHQYALGQQKKVALWKCLGATSKVIIRSQILFLIILSVPVIVLSVAVAYLLVAILLTFGGSWGLSPGLLSYQGGLLGALSGVGILFGFALAPILGLRKILPVAILQETQPAIHSSNLLSYGLGLLFFVGIIYLFMGDSEIALRLGAIIAIATAALFGVSWILWQFLTPLTKIIPITWRFGLSYLLRHRWQTILQWLVFTLVITLLLVVQIISVDFITQWRQGLSATTPNYFLINIYPEQVSPLQTWFNTEKIPDVQFYPIVRGRMDNARHGIGRPLNLTWMKTLPADNQVIKGQDWSDIHYGQGALSVEEGFAQRQNLQLGDTLTFQIENESVTGKIVQLRSVSWGSFKPNFFVIFAPGNLERFPHTYITSFYLPASQKILIPSIIKNYSEIAVIDIQAILDKIRFMINKIAYALEFLLLLVFILGIVIMYACILFSQKERTIENAILRIVGAQRKFIGKVILTEFLILGTLTGISASVLAALITTDLAHTYFSIPFTFRWHWILMGMLISMTLIPFFGLIGARKVLQIPALKLLRNTY
jgi:putative ABC transport system permease protein